MIRVVRKPEMATEIIRTMVLRSSNALIVVRNIICMAILNVSFQVISPRNAARHMRNVRKITETKTKTIRFWRRAPEAINQLAGEFDLFCRGEL